VVDDHTEPRNIILVKLLNGTDPQLIIYRAVELEEVTLIGKFENTYHWDLALAVTGSVEEVVKKLSEIRGIARISSYRLCPTIPLENTFCNQ